MIVKLIKNPNPPKLFGYIPYYQRRDRQELPSNARLPIVLPDPPTQRPNLQLVSGGMPPEWDKVKYARWIESVKDAFPKGTLVTLNIIHNIPHKLPFYFKVEDHLEIQNQVKWDGIAWEPRAVVCVFESKFGGSRVLDARPPSTLRRLTPEELTLVDLQNQKPEGHS